MKLLILTQYFPPEVGAPQNRLFELALHLLPLGVEVTVLTGMPNYPQMEIYEGYKGKTYDYETMDGIQVHRSAIYASKKKSVVARLRNYFSFVLSSALTGNKKLGAFDFLLCESPPLFLGYSARYLAKRKKAKLIFNVSDLWPESAEKLGVVTNPLLLKLAYRLEAKLYKRSALVTGQTQGICRNIQTRFPTVKTYWLPNGVDLKYYNPSLVGNVAWRTSNGFLDTDFICAYAGIIGLAQGLEIILEAAVQFKNRPFVKFVLIGSGPEKEKLQQLKVKNGLDQVYFLDAVQKKEMPRILKSINATIVPLRKLDLFLGAIPSKLFENLAMEVPVLLGVNGEARQLFIEQGKCGIYFVPEQVTSLVAGIEQLIGNKELCAQLGKNGRQYVEAFFNRAKIAREFYDELVKLELKVIKD